MKAVSNRHIEIVETGLQLVRPYDSQHISTGNVPVSTLCPHQVYSRIAFRSPILINPNPADPHTWL